MANYVTKIVSGKLKKLTYFEIKQTGLSFWIFSSDSIVERLLYSNYMFDVNEVWYGPSLELGHHFAAAMQS